jgi:hypothetical protein
MLSRTRRKPHLFLALPAERSPLSRRRGAGSSSRLLDVLRMAAETPLLFGIAAERPIHLGAIQLETLNLARLFFEQVICVCE